MIKNKSNIIIAFLALIYCSSFLTLNVWAESSDKIFLNHFNKKYTLSPIDYRGLNWNIYGEYQYRYAPTGGILLHLFPNNKFIYVEWCDICEDKMIAKGTYELKNSKIFLSYDYFNKDYKKKTLNDSLNALYARPGGESYGYTVILVNDKNYGKLKKDPNLHEYMFRLREYPDWQEIYNSLEKKK